MANKGFCLSKMFLKVLMSNHLGVIGVMKWQKNSKEQKMYLCESCLCKEQILGVMITHGFTGWLLFVAQRTCCLKQWHKSTAYLEGFDVLNSNGRGISRKIQGPNQKAPFMISSAFYVAAFLEILSIICKMSTFILCWLLIKKQDISVVLFHCKNFSFFLHWK